MEGASSAPVAITESARSGSTSTQRSQAQSKACGSDRCTVQHAGLGLDHANFEIVSALLASPTPGALAVDGGTSGPVSVRPPPVH